MTVHKSQGSEFDRVALVLAESDAPVLTRELLYTGVTRARTGVEILSPRDVLIRTVLRRISRESGLADALRDPDRNGRGILQ
jgi:exodeoxyribonuclease V alpha subunit